MECPDCGEVGIYLWTHESEHSSTGYHEEWFCRNCMKHYHKEVSKRTYNRRVGVWLKMAKELEKATSDELKGV